jgi:RNA polymerase sigma factor (sigma-70 family)
MASPDRHGIEVPDDMELLRRARGGDRGAYGDLVRRHQAAALRVAAGICGSTEEARDIVQDAFVKGYRMLDGFRGDAPVRAWMLRIVANDAKNARRGRHRRERRQLRYELAVGPRPAIDATADRVVEAEEADRLLAMLAALDVHDREVLVHRFVAGLSEHETAAVLGLPVGTVKSRTARALGRARELVGEGGRG